MAEWNQQIQTIVNEIDKCIENSNDEDLILKKLSQKLGYSEFYVTRKFKEISGIHFRTYLREKICICFKRNTPSEYRKNPRLTLFDCYLL